MNQDDETSRKARRDLERLGSEGGLTSTPQLKTTADGVRRHFAAADADQSDPAEVWGTRIGRFLGAVAFIALLAWLSYWLFG